MSNQDVSVVFLVNIVNKTIYIQQRHPNKNLGGTYEPIQEKVKDCDRHDEFAHLQEQREYLECAIRGIQEEVGITITRDNIERILTLQNLEITDNDGNVSYIRGEVFFAYTEETPTPNPSETIPAKSYFRTLKEVDLLKPQHPALSHILPQIRGTLEQRLLA